METNGNSGLGGPWGTQSMASNKHLQCAQAQVDEVVGIMRDNVDKVVQRDQNISELNKKAEFLDAEAQQFVHNADKLKQKMWWKNAKMLIIMGAIAATIFIVLIVWLV